MKLESKLQRMEEVELQRFSSEAAMDHFKEVAAQYDPVKLHLAVNAYVSGFYMGARHIEKYGPSYDGRPWWRKILVLRPKPTMLDYAADAAQHYVQGKYPNLKAEDWILVQTCVSLAFRKGWEFRLSKEISDGKRQALGSTATA